MAADIQSVYNFGQAMASREQNEKKFRSWQEMPDGGRVHWFDIAGHHGWRARYLKQVDGTETTTRFWQEIYEDKGTLMEVHQKFPNDLGHRKA